MYVNCINDEKRFTTHEFGLYLCNVAAANRHGLLGMFSFFVSAIYGLVQPMLSYFFLWSDLNWNANFSFQILWQIASNSNLDALAFICQHRQSWIFYGTSGQSRPYEWQHRNGIQLKRRTRMRIFQFHCKRKMHSRIQAVHCCWKFVPRIGYYKTMLYRPKGFLY